MLRSSECESDCTLGPNHTSRTFSGGHQFFIHAAYQHDHRQLYAPYPVTEVEHHDLEEEGHSV
jgi:hypothetical protein